MTQQRKTWLAIIGPGILVAATGVGAGDLATSAFTGSALGLTILWAVLMGAFFKFVLNEGLARWQLATGSTLLEGFSEHFGRGFAWCFLAYLVVWSFLVAAALMSAMGVTCHAIYPLFGDDAQQANKIAYGILHSVVAVGLVLWGGYPVFEKVMGLCIAAMFAVVVVTAIGIGPSWSEVATGMFLPRIPPGGVPWTIALIGGVGGTVTVLSYGYWIREEGREGGDAVTTCRIDLASGYAMTAIFGLGMVVIGSTLGPLEGGGAGLVVHIADCLEQTFGGIGPVTRWAFLLGAWGAVFSSLLGVWQGVPYLFADVWAMRGGSRSHHERVDTTALPYRGYLVALASLPIIGLVMVDFRTMQKTYAVVGAIFIPALAILLLLVNGRAKWVGPQFKNSLATSAVLVAIVLFFVFAAVTQLRG